MSGGHVDTRGADEARPTDPRVAARGSLSRVPWHVQAYLRQVWRRFTLTTVAGSVLVPTPLRWLVLRAFGVRTERCGVSAGVRISGVRLSIGKYTFINTECFFDTSADITVGTECAIGLRVQFITSSHRTGPSARRAGAVTTAPIRIGNGVWIGSGAIILPGVTVGDGAVVAAGAVVNRDCDPDTLYGGVPARPIRSLV